ncbi:MAG: nitroreductase family protein [Desulfohalobiaceae bacterium]|nr:nitroreductase family protein [Desulfohalobiaceae bacterium]
MFLELLEKRRSIRAYTDKPVEQEKIDQLIEAALRAPSSRGSTPWKFIVVTDGDLLQALSKAKSHGAAFLKTAKLAFVICADPAVSDVWIEDASVATLSIHLMAESLGLGSCWVQIRERMHDEGQTAEAYLSDLLGIPEGLRVLSMISIGYPAEEKPAHSRDKLPFAKVSFNRYGWEKS